MRAYSVDLRERIAAAAEQENSSVRAVARQFGVSAATVSRYARQKRQQQTLAPKRPPGGKRRLEEATLAALLQQVEQQPDQTLTELHAWLGQHYPAVSVSRATVHRALVGAGLTYKKRRWSPPSEMRRSAPPGGRP
jgi:putative transposase